MYQHPINRSPVARDMFKTCRRGAIPPKKGKGSKYKRVKKVSYYD